MGQLCLYGPFGASRFVTGRVGPEKPHNLEVLVSIWMPRCAASSDVGQSLCKFMLHAIAATHLDTNYT